MEVKLVVSGGKQAGKEIPVPGPKFLIGRAEDCQLRPQSDLVSRHHCAILLAAGEVTVKDFGSRNGTFVNGEQVADERALKTGDKLKVGPLEFEVQLSVPVGGKKKPKVHNIQEAAARTVRNAGDKGNKGDKGEMDVAGWIDDEEEEEDVATQDARAPDTQPFSATPTSPGAPVPEAAAEDPTQVVPTAMWNKKPMAESSRAAAADVLRQMFQRKP
jgi:pSer/pThr/pTyr-binding forkhead associated (FHA) protein